MENKALLDLKQQLSSTSRVTTPKNLARQITQPLYGQKSGCRFDLFPWSFDNIDMTILRIIIVLLLSLTSSISYAQGGDTSGREFIMSCTYGVLAGTLVGAATLAFEDQPGDNLNKVARGASIGLYAGILLGAYVVYGVSDGGEEYDQYIEEGLPPVEGEGRARPKKGPSFLVGLAPVFDPQQNISGASAQLSWSLF